MTEEKRARIAGMDRRTFCLGAGCVAALAGLGVGLKVAGSRSLVRPPGGQDEERLLAQCVRCEKCLTVCPHRVITPAHAEDGLVGMRTPQLDFEEAYCDWCAEANNGVPLCEQACPTGALSLPADARKETVVMGVARLDTEQCLAWRMLSCRFCYDACEFEAIELDDFSRPSIVEDRCVGCGACESVCVSMQNGSIGAGATERAVIVHGLNDGGEF